MTSAANIIIRQAIPTDAEKCGQIIYAAFKGINDKHGFPHDFKNIEHAVHCAEFQISHSLVFGVVAEKDNQIVGSNFLSQLTPIYGIGPITVDPKMQGYGIGRMLMEAVLKKGKDARGIRLMQDAYNTASLSLYTSLGFTVKEPLLLVTGKPKQQSQINLEVRPLELSDLESCAILCHKVLGFDRTNELRDALKYDRPLVAVRDNRIVAYATAITQWTANHAVAETNEDLFALLLGAAKICNEPLSFLLPTRNTDLVKWCFQQGLKGISPRTLMTMGEYQEPNGSYLPSVLY